MQMLLMVLRAGVNLPAPALLVGSRVTFWCNAVSQCLRPSPWMTRGLCLTCSLDVVILFDGLLGLEEAEDRRHLLFVIFSSTPLSLEHLSSKRTWKKKKYLWKELVSHEERQQGKYVVEVPAEDFSSHVSSLTDQIARKLLPRST